MLYFLLKLIMRVATWLAYRRVVRCNLERLENGRATLILANHSASFMDAMLMGVVLRRRVHFFTRGDVFAKPLANKILRALGMLPVYRISEGKENMHRNDDTNAEALRVLAAGGAVLIFAEGTSALEKRLKPLKKGPFRLAALAAAQGLGPVIATVGINYVTPAKAAGDVFIAAGDSIDAAALGEGSEARLATHTMRLADDALRGVVWDAQDSEKAALADAALLQLQEHNHRFSFDDTMAVVAGINSGVYQHPPSVARRTASQWLALILFSPFAAVGFAFHYLPVRAAMLAADKQVREPDFYAPVVVGAAVLLVLLWYAVWAVALVVLWKMELLLLLPVMAYCGVIYQKRWRYWLG